MLLTELFGVCRKLTAIPVSDSDGETIRQVTALEILVAAKVLSAYAMRMKRYEYLEPFLKEFVFPVSPTAKQKREPFLFWPLRLNVPGHDRIAYVWDAVVKPHWLNLFGSQRSFLDSACQLEFILFLNSYFATQIREVAQWIAEYRSDTNFAYWQGSDLWRYSLNSVVPLAEKIFEDLAMGPDPPLLLHFSVEHPVFQKAFTSSMTAMGYRQQDVFIECLRGLVKWQAQAASSQGRFSPESDWGPVLGPRIAGASQARGV